MNAIKKFFYTDVMTQARKLNKIMGIPLILFLILYAAVINYILFPLMGKLWGLVLLTTPEGFISNANILQALIHSPWIIPLALIFVIVYALIVLWQTTAILVAIGYRHMGQRIRLRDLIKVSFLQLKHRLRKSNWVIVVYALIIVPLSNVYQTSDMISKFIMPEYIQDFINSKTLLAIGCGIIALCLVYIALRWYFLLPAFILKGKDFKEAKNESNTLTHRSFIRNGLDIGLYYLGELIRLSILPGIIIILPLFICYYATSSMEFATSLFTNIGLSIGFEAVNLLVA